MTTCGVRSAENRLNDKRPSTEQAVGEQPFREAILPPRLAARRQKLAQKAKQEPQFRFYSLYGGVMDRDTLHAAWCKVCFNGGAPGVDGISIEQIAKKENGEQNLLREIGEELRTKTYRPQPVIPFERAFKTKARPSTDHCESQWPIMPIQTFIICAIMSHISHSTLFQ